MVVGPPSCPHPSSLPERHLSAPVRSILGRHCFRLCIIFQSWPVSMATDRLKDEQRAGRRGWSELSGWWCVSLTSPSTRLDRTILATPIQGCWPCCFIRRTARVSDSSANSLFCSSHPLPPPRPQIFPLAAPFLFWLPTVRKNAQINPAGFRDALLPSVLEGHGGMAALYLTWRRCAVRSLLCKSTDYAEIYRSGLL